MSAVVQIRNQAAKRLHTLEEQIRTLCIDRRKVSDTIADKLLEIDELELWKSENYPSFQQYLEAFSDELAKEAIELAPATMSSLLHGARFRRDIDEGKLPKKYKAFLDRTTAHDRGRLAQAVRTKRKLENRSGATPINEATAFKMLIDEGYYDGTDRATQDRTAEAQRNMTRQLNPEVLKRQLRFSFEDIVRQMSGHKKSFIAVAVDDAQLRRAARKVVTLINRHIIEV